MTRRRLSVAFVGIAVLIAPAARAEAPAWLLEDGSSIRFVYVHDGAEKQGHFARFSADIRLDPADPSTAEIGAEIDLASVSAGTQDADDSLKSGDWFNVKAFPKAIFKSTGVRKDGAGYVMAATLTIRGQAVPVELPFTLDVDGTHAHAAGQLTLDRTAFGLGGGFWANPKFIGNDVAVTVDLKAHREE